MKLRIGILSPSGVWEQICRQEGIPCGVVDLREEGLNDACSVLAITRPLVSDEVNAVTNYLRRGGGVIGCAQHLAGVHGMTYAKQRIEYVLSEPDDVLPGIHLLDLGIEGAVPREANALRTQASTYAVFAGRLGEGRAVLLPFDPGVIDDQRVANKNFYSRSERLPAERVSLVTKGEVQQTIHRAFEFLHHARGLPYAHLWYFPDGHANMFAFRVDTDKAQQREIDETYALARDYEIGLSWYLDVKSHVDWLRHFHGMAGQELGVHCFEHQVYPTVDGNLKNISRALREMREAGLDACGFAAPFGQWSPELAEAVEELGFVYSSEFSYLYDAFPLYPVGGSKRYRTLQIPVHPICCGSMQKVGYSESQMKDYFDAVIERKLGKSEPLFFYDHPIHRRWDVIRSLFSAVKAKSIPLITLGEYARWWTEREKIELEIDSRGDVLAVPAMEHTDERFLTSIMLRITKPDGNEALIAPVKEIVLSRVTQWKATPTPLPSPDDVRRIREFDLRGTLGDLYTTFARKLR